MGEIDGAARTSSALHWRRRRAPRSSARAVSFAAGGEAALEIDGRAASPRGRARGAGSRRSKTFNPTSMCAKSKVRDQTLRTCFENATRANDPSKNHANPSRSRRAAAGLAGAGPRAPRRDVPAPPAPPRAPVGSPRSPGAPSGAAGRLPTGERRRRGDQEIVSYLREFAPGRPPDALREPWPRRGAAHGTYERRASGLQRPGNGRNRPNPDGRARGPARPAAARRDRDGFA